MPNPAEQLEGLTIGAGWQVGPLIARNPLATGGNFSQSYRASHPDGRLAFVKALDFHRAFRRGGNTTRILLVEYCGGKGLDRVVRAIETGTVDVDPTDIAGRVPYLIFEAADCDVRSHLDDPAFGAGLAWRIRSLHHIATGLKQLHGIEVAHQDLKPSNVLVFRAASVDRVSKLADLGRASRADAFSPFDHLDWAGDPNYKPPEAWYSFISPDWHQRRIAYDLYMLGSLMSFMFIRTHANAALWQALSNQHWPQHWCGDFDSVLPFLTHAFTTAAGTFEAQLHPALAADLMPIYRQLCEPDPRKRGHPGQALNKLALERFVTKFDVMAVRATIGKYGKA
jgi:serine/threonine protein kinase